MFLGYRLKELRKSKKWSQAQLGKELGVSKVSISGYEKGTRVPSMEILLMIIKLFDVSADFLLGRELNIVCEDDGNTSILLSGLDVQIIKEIRSRPALYNQIAENPERFFSTVQN